MPDGVPMSLADFFTLDLQESPQVLPARDEVTDMPSHEGAGGDIILKGNMDLTVGGQSRVPGPGDAYYFARAVPHRFRSNVGDEP